MPTVAASNFATHHRTAGHGFLLDAGELCSHGYVPSLSDLGGLTDKGSCPLHHALHSDSQGADTDSLLLGLAYSDDALSPGASHVNGTAAMQFLLLDDDEVAAVAMAADQVHATDTYSLSAPLAAPVAAAPMATMPSMLRQCSDNSSDATRASVPYIDSSDLYCLAVVDEATGLPLRPATPEETWEVERCFVLQQQSELLDVVLAQEQQLQQGQDVAMGLEQRAGSAVAESFLGTDSPAGGGIGAEPAAGHEESRNSGEAASVEGQEEEQEQCREEEEARCGKQHAPAARPTGPSARRPDQPRRCGPCDNCGATESPQWRQGPPAKPLLCNACGMRFRRTNQLVAGETGASGSRGGARGNKKPSAAAAAPSPALVIEQRPRPKPVKSSVAPPLVAPDAKRPRRAAAVAAAASFAAIDVV